MKINLNPLAKLIEKAEQRVNIQHMPQSQDIAHDRKRRAAEAVLAGGTPTPEFQQAAQIEGMTVETLAKAIVSKPDALMARENERRQVIVKLRQAKNQTELNQILDAHGIKTTGLITHIRP
jgi:hypothetical protein